MNQYLTDRAASENVRAVYIQSQGFRHDGVCVSVSDAVDPDAEKAVERTARLARSYINCCRIRRRDRDRAYGQRQCIIKKRGPHGTAVQRAVKTTLCRANICNIG